MPIGDYIIPDDDEDLKMEPGIIVAEADTPGGGLNIIFDDTIKASEELEQEIQNLTTTTLNVQKWPDEGMELIGKPPSWTIAPDKPGWTKGTVKSEPQEEGWIGTPPVSRKWINKKGLNDEKLKSEGPYDDGSGGVGYDFVPTGQGNLITSYAGDIFATNTKGGKGGAHFPVIDIDVPMTLVPSSTPGHSHLYIDRKMSSATYHHLLISLVEAGLVEEGYLEFYQNTGYTAVRAPGEVKFGVSAGTGDIIRQNAHLKRVNHALYQELQYYRGLVANAQADPD